MLNPELTNHAQTLSQQNVSFAIATVVRAESPTAARPGDKAIVSEQGEIFGWIGGGCAQPAVIKTARQVIREKKPLLILVSPNQNIQQLAGVTPFRSSCPSGGSLEIFIEPVTNKPTLWVLGSSPAAMKIAELASVSEFDVYVAAPSGTVNQFPSATHFQSEFEFAKNQMVTADFIIVATQGKRDMHALQFALSIESRFIGFVASNKKAKKYKNDLLEKGYSAEDVQRIVSPAGLALGGNSACDIALSVLVQLTQIKNAPQTNSMQSSEVSKPDTQSMTKETTKAGGCCGS